MRQWIIIGTLFMGGLSAQASEWITCKVQASNDKDSAVFKPFDDGDFVMDITNGDAFLRATSADGNVLTKTLVNAEFASSYGTPRKTCEYQYSVSRDQAGKPESFFIAFGSCHLRRPDGTMIAVVSASEFYDFKKANGLYLETYYQGSTTAIQPSFKFKDCQAN